MRVFSDCQIILFTQLSFDTGPSIFAVVHRVRGELRSSHDRRFSGVAWNALLGRLPGICGGGFESKLLIILGKFSVL